MTGADDLSMEHLQELISTMSEWSIGQKWTAAQTAAWRLRWFGKTPQQDADDRDTARQHWLDYVQRCDETKTANREPLTDWPNNQGTYD
jgi:glutathione S-transferase